MTTDEKKLAQRSFVQISPLGDLVATLFYNRLFELDPSLRSLFQVTLEDQSRKLMQALTMIIVGLDRPEDTLPVIRSLGARHAQYGVRVQHYDTVSSALLWTLEKGLGDDFTPDVKSAWMAVYALLANEMKAGAQQAASA